MREHVASQVPLKKRERNKSEVIGVGASVSKLAI
jgi:hypothetical protein